MLINVRVIAGAKREMIVEEMGGLKVYLRAPAVEGKANAALIKVLAEHFGVSVSRVRIVRGERSRAKTVEWIGGS